MMKPDHAITKYDSTPPRPFSRAFHPIYLVAAEVTRLKLNLAARFERRVQVSPSQSESVQPSQTKANLREADVRHLLRPPVLSYFKFF